MLIVVPLGIDEPQGKQAGGAKLPEKGPVAEKEGPKTEDQLSRYGDAVEEKDYTTGLDGQQRENLQRIVQVAEAFALSAVHLAPRQLSMAAMRS